jgi:predicted amidohydrolase YtcJ
LPVRVHACLRDDAVATAVERGFRSGSRVGADPEGRAIVGWQKCFADGSLGSRTAALLEDIEPEADRPLPVDLRRGVWMSDVADLRERVRRAADGGIASTIHAIGDAAVRGALDVLTPFAATAPLMPRVEHVQMLHPDDRPRFAAAGIAASVQPVHLGSDALQAWKLWGDRAEAEAYTWKSIADTGAVMPFGTDAPVESYDPWPGLALAVRRDDPRWPSGTPTYAPEQSLTLDRALRANCIDAPVSAREADRGRLTVGQRADIVVIPAASIDEPVSPGGPLSATRPQLVLMDGKVVVET